LKKSLIRIGHPIENLAHGYAEEISSPMYSTAIGLLQKGIEDVEAGRIKYNLVEPKAAPVAEKPKEEIKPAVEEPEEKNWLNGLFQKTKEWFETEPDSGF